MSDIYFENLGSETLNLDLGRTIQPYEARPMDPLLFANMVRSGYTGNVADYIENDSLRVKIGSHRLTKIGSGNVLRNLDPKIRVSATDLEPDYFGNKITAGRYINVSSSHVGGVESLVFDVSDSVEGKSRYVKGCANLGTSSDVWLQFHSNLPSNENPFVLPELSVLRALSATAKNWVSENPINFTVYKNGVTLTTITLDPGGSHSLKATKKDLYLILEEGSALSVKAPKSVGGVGNARNPAVDIFIMVL